MCVCASVHVCGTGELWTHEGNGVTVDGKHWNQPSLMFKDTELDGAGSGAGPSPPESTFQRPGEHQVSYACNMLCQDRKCQPVKVVTLFPGK